MAVDAANVEVFTGSADATVKVCVCVCMRACGHTCMCIHGMILRGRNICTHEPLIIKCGG